jgi:hypothetical protein
MKQSLEFKPYHATDRSACLALFDENCPEYFAPGERDDYATFLDSATENYVVCRFAHRIVGAYGLYLNNPSGAALHWILLSTSSQGLGLGSTIMSRVIDEVRLSGRVPLLISASHKSAPFFARFGAIETARVPDGWGPGMHRVEMRLIQ